MYVQAKEAKRQWAHGTKTELISVLMHVCMCVCECFDVACFTCCVSSIFTNPPPHSIASTFCGHCWRLRLRLRAPLPQDHPTRTVQLLLACLQHIQLASLKSYEPTTKTTATQLSTKNENGNKNKNNNNKDNISQQPIKHIHTYTRL